MQPQTVYHIEVGQKHFKSHSYSWTINLFLVYAFRRHMGQYVDNNLLSKPNTTQSS